MLMLRVLSRGLILWSDIEPTEEWIRSQIPKCIPDSVYRAMGVISKKSKTSAENKENVRETSDCNGIFDDSDEDCASAAGEALDGESSI
jgi:uncharacterized membrane protein